MLEPSIVQFYDKDLSALSKLIFYVFRLFGLIRVTQKEVDDAKGKLILYESSNFTIINFYLIKMGPTREDKLTFNLLVVQVRANSFLETLK